ncbi:MAG: FAD-linked oxidase [Nitrospirales bacterium]|nr:MAG: FAD-linked oxidase [Nitrospirales bacterium]
MQDYQSWGGYPKSNPKQVHTMSWRHESIAFEKWDTPVLPYAYGRSYGDSCQNDGGILLLTKGLQRFLAFDAKRGILRCEGGVSLSEILGCFISRGWFPPVTPGTKYVSVGGAIANDVHGKNHHRAGTFGCHVLQFELLRSTGDRLVCSPEQHSDLFQATIGGLGLTGIILWADIQLKPISNPFIHTEKIQFSSLDEFFELTEQSDHTAEYTVAWIDCLAHRRHLGRGIFIRGNHAGSENRPTHLPPTKRLFSIPCHAPAFFLNRYLLKVFNTVYFHHQPARPAQEIEFYDEFFYPLDRVQHWNRLYGTRGFLQYQCVIPTQYEREGIHELLSIINESKQGSFLAVLKKFGNVRSPGLLSFPRSGTTLALDFPFLGEKTLSLLAKLDQIVRKTDGAVYPAKDARMSAQDFKTYFPKWKTFCRYTDPKFSSDFWKRIINTREPDSSTLENPPCLHTHRLRETSG